MKRVALLGLSTVAALAALAVLLVSMTGISNAQDEGPAPGAEPQRQATPARDSTLPALAEGGAAVCLDATSRTCQEVYLVLMVEPPLSPMLASVRTGARVTVTAPGEGTFADVVPASGRVLVTGRFYTSATPVTVTVGPTGTRPAYTNAVNLPCECTSGLGLQQVRVVNVAPTGATIPSTACSAQNPTCQPVWLALQLPEPVPPATTSAYHNAQYVVTARLTDTLVVVASGLVPPDGRVFHHPISSNLPITISVGPTGTAPAFFHALKLPCTCDAGADLHQVVAVVLTPWYYDVVMPHACPPIFLPALLGPTTAAERWADR